MIIDAHRVPPCLCPVCGAKIDAATNADGNPVTPRPDDISICLYCTSFLAFNADLSIREVSDDEIAELPHEVRMDLQHYRRAAKRMKLEA